MRIIDKNYDFYDYLSDNTDTIVFDRRDSYVLKKDKVTNVLYHPEYFKNNTEYSFILIQAGNTFWLILVTLTLTIRGKWRYYHIENWSPELLIKWKNYNKPSTILNVSVIKLHYLYKLYDRKTHTIVRNKIVNNVNDIVKAIDNSNYDVINDLNEYLNYYGKKNKNAVLILRESGLSTLIEPQDMFLAIEEHFSQEITKNERREPIGMTNDMKVTSHGFDTVYSFRNKK